MVSLLGVLENGKLGTEIWRGVLVGVVVIIIIIIYFNRKENGKFANLK